MTLKTLNLGPTVSPAGQSYFPPISSVGSFLISTKEHSLQTGSSSPPTLVLSPHTLSPSQPRFLGPEMKQVRP